MDRKSAFYVEPAKKAALQQAIKQRIEQEATPEENTLGYFIAEMTREVLTLHPFGIIQSVDFKANDDGSITWTVTGVELKKIPD